MFIATYNAIYALEDNGHNEPIQVYKGTDHQCLDGNAMVALPESQAVAVALSDGTLLLLSEGDTKRIPTGIKDSDCFVAPYSRKSVDTAHRNG